MALAIGCSPSKAKPLRTANGFTIASSAQPEALSGLRVEELSMDRSVGTGHESVSNARSSLHQAKDGKPVGPMPKKMALEEGASLRPLFRQVSPRYPQLFPQFL